MSVQRAALEVERLVRSSSRRACRCSGVSAALKAACLVRLSPSRVLVCSGVSAPREAAILLEADVLLPKELLFFVASRNITG
ncbi:unnamed protein product, partial [Rotaria sp. Silwood2]